MKKVTVLAGDGIGPEIIKEAVKVLLAAMKKFDIDIQVEEKLIGGAAIDEVGVSLPKDTLKSCLDADAILLGCVGGPQWEDQPMSRRPESALLELRRQLDVYANLRPARPFPSLLSKAPLKDELLKDVDLILVRELTAGIYFGNKERKQYGRSEKASDSMVYTDFEIERVARKAFSLAQKRRGKLTCVDKANYLETSRLWRKVLRVVRKDYPDVALDFMYVDDCALQLAINPGQFDVILTENIFGDILSNEATALLVGSVGVLPSASLSDEGKTAIFGPIHGSVPELTGQDKANPLGAILSAALLLRYCLGHEEAARSIEDAVNMTLEDGYRSCELMTPGMKLAGTAQLGDLIAAKV